MKGSEPPLGKKAEGEWVSYEMLERIKGKKRAAEIARGKTLPFMRSEDLPHDTSALGVE